MRFNHTKLTRDFIDTSNKTYPLVKSRVIRADSTQFNALKEAIVPERERLLIKDEIPMTGYVIKRI